MGQFGHLGDVGQLGQGIGRRLQKQQPRLGPDRLFPPGVIAQADKGGLHTEAGQDIVE